MNTMKIENYRLIWLFLILSVGLMTWPTLLPYAQDNPLSPILRESLPPCDGIEAGPFIVSGGDNLSFTVTNTTTTTLTLTSATLNWMDYYDPDMFVDSFYFGGNPYWPGDDLDSPTVVTSTVPFPAMTSEVWGLDFDGYGPIYDVTHTIGPFSVELVFDGACGVNGDIALVEATIHSPTNGEPITSIEQTDFEAMANDTGVGSSNGDGIDGVHLVLLDPADNVIVNWIDSSLPYCVWGTENPCPTMSQKLWDTLPNGSYILIAWGLSAVTGSWSAPAQVTFILDRTLVTPTPTYTPTITPNPTDALTPTPTPSPEFWLNLPVVVNE